MANQIRITPDQMRERANQYRAEADTVNGVIKKMDSLLQQLQSEWEGAASESYAARYQELKGNLYSETYKAQLEALIDDYDLVISNIDTNMDRLNTARAQYENKAYKCNGPIGYLQSSVNSLVHTIENWVN